MERLLHIEESNLELFAYQPERFGEEETKDILYHIEYCCLCKDIYSVYKSIHNGMEEYACSKPDENDRDIAERITGKFRKRQNLKLLKSEKSIVQIYEGKADLITEPKFFSIEYIIYYIKNYPVQARITTLSMIFALFLIIVLFRTNSKDMNPVTLQNRNSILEAYNMEGELIWKKNIKGIPSYGIDSLTKFSAYEKKFISILDIDGDGKNEVLMCGNDHSGLYRSDSLYCLNNNGTLRWVASPEDPKYNYAPKWKRTNWMIMEFFTINTKEGIKLFVIAHVESYGGAILSTLNPEDGSVTSSLYHSGYFTSQTHYDMDRDGNDEIFLGGTSSFDKPFLMVLKSYNLMGVMPDYFSKSKLIPGNAMYYILLPLSGLYPFSETPLTPNVERSYKYNEDGILVLTTDYIDNAKSIAYLQFAFNSKMECEYVTSGSSYNILYDKYFKKGLLTKSLD